MEEACVYPYLSQLSGGVGKGLHALTKQYGQSLPSMPRIPVAAQCCCNVGTLGEPLGLIT